MEILLHRGLLPLVEMGSASLSRDGVPNRIQPPRVPLYEAHDSAGSDPLHGKHSNEWLFGDGVPLSPHATYSREGMR
jgi:hypothetical protein